MCLVLLAEQLTATHRCSAAAIFQAMTYRCLDIHAAMLLQQQDDEGEEEDVQAEDSGADGFVVSDHYLSDDEGVHSAQMNLDDMCAELQGALPDCMKHCMLL